MLELERILKKVKLRLMGKDPFLATLAVDLPIRFSDEVPTAGTDGTEILINPSFWLNLKDPTRVGLIAHEIMHVVYMHSFRRNNRDPKKWNWAADYVINLVLVEEGYELPEGALFDRSYEGMCTERVYELLPDFPSSNSNDPLSGDVIDNPSKEAQRTTASKVNNAKMSNSDQGKGGEEVSRLIDDILRPQLPWHAILLQYCTDLRNQDYSWSRPNRRYNHVYLPSLQNTEYGMGGVNVFIDLSGSIDDKTLNVFLTELKNIWEACNPDWIDIMGFSTRLNPATRIEEDWHTDFNRKSTRGTSGEPVLNYINSCKDECVNIIFTDGYIDTPPTKKKNVFWIILDNPSFSCNYGRVLHLES